MDRDLTETEKRYLDFAIEYWDFHNGIGPGYADLMEKFKVSKSTVQSTFASIREKGFIYWEKRKFKSVVFPKK